MSLVKLILMIITQSVQPTIQSFIAEAAKHSIRFRSFRPINQWSNACVGSSVHWGIQGPGESQGSLGVRFLIITRFFNGGKRWTVLWCIYGFSNVTFFLVIRSELYVLRKCKENKRTLDLNIPGMFIVTLTVVMPWTNDRNILNEHLTFGRPDKFSLLYFTSTSCQNLMRSIGGPKSVQSEFPSSSDLCRTQSTSKSVSGCITVNARQKNAFTKTIN